MNKFNLFSVISALSLIASAQAMELRHVGKWGFTALMDAARKGHLENVKTLIAQRADVNQKDINEWTALMFAIGYRESEIAKVLIEAKANINQAESYGKTPLIFAAQKGLNDIVQKLIAEGANINQAEKEGIVTALWVAEHNRHQTTAQILIAAGADKSKGYKNQKPK